MVFYCCAYNCKHSTKDKNLTFHSFPLKNPELLKKWLRNMRWKDWSPEPHSKICSSHFERRCYSLISGSRRRLHTWAVPTIFSFPEHLQNKKRKIDPRSRRAFENIDGSVLDLPSRRSSHCSTAVSAEPEQNTGFTEEQTQRSEESSLQNIPEPITEEGTAQSQPKTSQSLVKPLKRPPPWTILGDEWLERNVTVPSFFHSGYCLPRSFRWDGDDEVNTIPHGISGDTKPRIIEVKERWEWLGLDIRGPFSITTHRHTHIMTLTDYCSKWVEAFPLTQNKIRDAAACLAEVILQLGYPLGILSRLPKHYVFEINRNLKKYLNVNLGSLVLHHRQTGSLDLVTESLLNELVCELVKEHPNTWHIQLPAASLRFCCSQHPTTGEKPFTLMHSAGPPALSSPRELPFSPSEIRLSSFNIPYIEENKKRKKENSPCAQSSLLGHSSEEHRRN